jgi:protein SCO1/2
MSQTSFHFHFPLLLITIASLALQSCQQPQRSLPILGERETTTRIVNGQTITDTIYHTIPPFDLLDQDNQHITQQTTDGKIYVADFFFTHCPTICPTMKKQMLRIYEQFKDEPNLILLSHSIDPRHDSVPVLKTYANKLGITANKWHLLYGNQDTIFHLAKEYFVAVAADSTAPGGVVHSGHFILVDPKRRVRNYYNGTDPKDVDVLMNDIRSLLLFQKNTPQ